MRKGLTLVKCCRFVTVTRQSLAKNKPPIRQDAPSNEPTPNALAQKTCGHFLKFKSSLPPHSLTFKIFGKRSRTQQKLSVDPVMLAGKSLGSHSSLTPRLRRGELYTMIPTGSREHTTNELLGSTCPFSNYLP